jgi:hypothetical protein
MLLGNMRQARVTDAPESNAGDDFHVLWAARKCMELLQLGRTKLMCIAIEGPETKEAERIDPTGSNLLGIDITEYFEGEDFQNATRIVFSQLKYSTRRASINYTLSKLCLEGKKPIFKRFADVYRAYCAIYPKNEVLDKIRFKLVSNREIDPAFHTILLEIQRFLISDSRTFTTANLKKALPHYSRELDRLKKVTRLKSVEFTQFLTLLDFEDCGVGSRQLQKHHILQAISDSGVSELARQYNGLYMLVHQKMMPDGQSNNKIVLTDILPVFGKGRLEDLFPLPPKIAKIDNVVVRSQTQSIAQQIVRGDASTYCFHGPAGVGKTTAVVSISDYLPANSVVILYDCYGGGTYLDESTLRHTYSGALTQICNDLSNAVGSPLLLASNSDGYDEYMRQFRRRITVASELLSTEFPEALLTIIVDASDNSINAAAQKGDPCFVRGLASLLVLPRNCRIVFTCRTSNIEKLGLSSECVQIEIAPFTAIETSEFLCRHFNECTQEQVNEFHRLTHGVPRVQYYAVQGKVAIADVFEVLYPEGITVATLIDSQIREANAKFGNAQIVEAILRGLVSLPRPIPLRYIAMVAETSEASIVDYCIDSWSGIDYKDSTVTFRDEDFESHITTQYSLTVDSYSKLSDQFLSAAKADEYACMYLGHALFKANRFSELQTIILEELHLEALKRQPLHLKEVYESRIHFGLKSCILSEDHSLFLKLVLLMAEGAKTVSARASILRGQLELASNFMDEVSLNKLFAEITSINSYGAAAFRCAAICSRKKQSKVQAERYLRQAVSWVKFYSRLTEEERRKFQIDEKDVAAGAEAVFRIYGLTATESWLYRWTSRDLVFSAICELSQVVVAQRDEEHQKNLDLLLGVRLDVVLVYIAELNKSGINYDLNWESICIRLLRFVKHSCRIKDRLKPYIVSFCEHATRKISLRKYVIEILSCLEFKLPEHPPRFFSSTYLPDENVSLDGLFRVSCLMACLRNESLDVSNLMPQRLRDSDFKKGSNRDDSTPSQAKEFTELYKHLYRAYMVRASVFMGIPPNDLNRDVTSLIASIHQDYNFRYSRHDASGAYFFMASSLSALVNVCENPKLFITAYKGFNGLSQANGMEMLLIIAEAASKNPLTHDTCIRLLYDVDQRLRQGHFSASDEIENYIRCSSIALAVDHAEAAIYFNRAVDCASNIDHEAYHQIYMLENISSRFQTAGHPKLANEIARFVENSGLKLNGYDKFPWRSGIAAVRNLDFNTAMWTWCVWDHKRHTDVTEQYPEFIHHALSKSMASAAQVCGLLEFEPFSYRWLDSIDTLVASKLHNNTIDLLLNKLCYDIRILCPLDRRGAFLEKLLPLLESNGLGKHRCTVQLKNLDEFLRSTGLRSQSDNFSRHPYSHSEQIQDELLANLIEATDPSDWESIQEALSRLSEHRESYQRGLVTQYLKGLKDKCRVTQYVEHLDALVGVDFNLLSYYDFERALLDRLQSWNYSQSVKLWMSNSLEKVVFHYFDHHFRDSDYSPLLSVSALNRIAIQLNHSDVDLATVLKSYLSNNPNRLSAESFYKIIPILSVLVSDEDCESILLWIVNRWNKCADDEVGNGFIDVGEFLTKEPQFAFAYYLRYCLGNPWKSIRWQAMHAIRRLASYADTQILSLLIDQRNNLTNGPFQDSRLPFYFHSCKLWLFIALRRIVEERPEILKGYKQQMYSEAIQQSDAHALIRLYAKEICLKLNQEFQGLFEEQEITALENVLVSVDGNLRSDIDEILLNENDGDDFPFDHLDTVRYWYDSLTSIFDVGMDEVIRIATAYIRLKWGYRGDPTSDSHLDLSSREYHKASNRQGAIPEIEDLRTYYEYHVMFFVANHLFESGVPMRSQAYESFSEWLYKHTIGLGGFWLSDEKGPTPLEEQFWKFGPAEKRETSWFSTISFEEFDQKIDVANADEPRFIVVSSSITRVNSRESEYTSISSALVCREKARTLLQTLQTYKQPSHYKLPDEGGWNEISEDGYVLRGWIFDDSLPCNSEESTDVRAKDLIQSVPNFGELFQDWLQSADGQFPSEHNLFKLENWSDYFDDKDYYPDFASKGYRLLIREDVLKAFLSASKLDLILECEIRKSNGINDGDTYYAPSFKLYSYSESGILETIRDIGTPDMELIRRFDEEGVVEPLERWKSVDVAQRLNNIA